MSTSLQRFKAQSGASNRATTASIMGRWGWRKGSKGGGAAASFQQVDTTPLPRKDMLVIFIMHVSQGFQVTMLFPLIVFMVTDFGVAEHNPHLVGRYAGFLASLFPFAQFCTSLLWGSISDRTGRKPVLFLGNLVASIAAVLFGLSGSYKMACLVRLFGGLLNGVITVTKSTLGELCDKTNQRQGFAVLSLAWGIGTIIGQVVGGIAARPCQQYAIENCPALLISYPFILPCLGAALFSAVAAGAVCFLEETLNRGGFEKIVYGAGILAKGSEGHEDKKGSLESYRDDELEKTALLQPVQQQYLPQNGSSVSGQTGRLGVGVSNEPETFARILAKLDAESVVVSRRLLGRLTGDVDTGYCEVGQSVLVSRKVPGLLGGNNDTGLYEVGAGNTEQGWALESEGLLNHESETTVSRQQGSDGNVQRNVEGEGAQVLESAGLLNHAAETRLEQAKSKGLFNHTTETGFEQLDLGRKVFSVEPGGSVPRTTDAEGVTLAGALGFGGNDLGYGKVSDLESGLDRREDCQGKKTRFYLRDPDVWVASSAFGLTAFIHIIGDELFPIFGAAPHAAGGLGYSASSIGVLGGLSGAVLFLFTLVFLKLNPRSARACFAAGTALYLPATCLMPLTSLLTSSPMWQWWLAAALMIEKQIAACIGFTGAMVLVSNSSDASNNGVITGFSHSIGSFARAAGPFVGGSMWSFSVSLQLPYAQFIPWELTTIMTMLALCLVVLAKPHLDSPKSERFVA